MNRYTSYIFVASLTVLSAMQASEASMLQEYVNDSKREKNTKFCLLQKTDTLSGQYNQNDIISNQGLIKMYLDDILKHRDKDCLINMIQFLKNEHNRTQLNKDVNNNVYRDFSNILFSNIESLKIDQDKKNYLKELFQYAMTRKKENNKFLHSALDGSQNIQKNETSSDEIHKVKHVLVCATAIEKSHRQDALSAFVKNISGKVDELLLDVSEKTLLPTSKPKVTVLDMVAILVYINNSKIPKKSKPEIFLFKEYKDLESENRENQKNNQLFDLFL